MKGFYTKQEAANILGVSVRQISNYLAEEKLSRIYVKRKVWIPQEDVKRIFDSTTRGPLLGQKAMYDLCERVERLELEIGTLKLGLGYGAPAAPRTEAELLLIRQKCMDALARRGWNRRRVSQAADDLMKLQPLEIQTLTDVCGATAWVPLCELATRMVSFVENQADYPAKGLDVLHARLTKALDRFYGVVYAATKVKLGIADRTAERVLAAIEVGPGAIDSHILDYISP